MTSKANTTQKDNQRSDNESNKCLLPGPLYGLRFFSDRNKELRI